MPQRFNPASHSTQKHHQALFLPDPFHMDMRDQLKIPYLPRERRHVLCKPIVDSMPSMIVYVILPDDAVLGLAAGSVQGLGKK